MTTQTALPTGTWKLDKAATTVTVTVKKLGFITVAGELAVTAGAIEIGDDNQVVSVEVTANAASYSSGNPKRDEHVKSDDFLDVEAHPTIVFRADKVTASGAGYQAKGTVTIKGKSTPITVDISGVKVDETTGSFTATSTVSRIDLGVDKMPGFVIGKELQLAVSAKATKA